MADRQHKPGYTQNKEQEDALNQLAKLGIVEFSDDAGDTAIFRLLTNCAICPVNVKSAPVLMSRPERQVWKWIQKAGLRLTIAELTLLSERGVKPVPALLGEQNRQELTETIYTAETIFDGTLETIMEKSRARDKTVRAVLGLLSKQNIFMI